MVACLMKRQVLLAMTEVNKFHYVVADTVANLGDHAHNKSLLLDAV
jgi:hypothetical protein